MAASTVALIGAGTTLSFEDPDNAETFLVLEEARTIGAIGEQGEFVETTPIKATTRTYIPGLRTPPDKEITGNDVPADAHQEKFLQLAANNQTVNMKVELSNGRTGAFVLALSGWQINEPQGGEALMWTVYSKQTGSVDWGIGTPNGGLPDKTADTYKRAA